MRLKISARKSDLARLQAYLVGDALKQKHPQLEIEFRFKESLGDKNLTDPLWKIPEKGVFTEDFYAELKRGDTDLVVHSWKDLPTENKPDTLIAATLPRADQRDLLLFKKDHGHSVASSRHLKILSSSPRREYNLTDFFKNHLPWPIDSVAFQSVRGNVPTRIRKLLEDSNVDGLIVAKAALDRLLSDPHPEFSETQTSLRQYLQQLHWMVLPLSINPNAAAQGALAIEIMTHRADLKELLASIHDESTFRCAQKERDVLSSFGGGCHQKIGVSILERPYGEIFFLRGLTDQGQTLKEARLHQSTQIPRFTSDALWCSETKPFRTKKMVPPLAPDINALLVARSDAWPEGLSFSGILWAAGLKTWRALAQKGLWVNGTFDGLGEQESAGIDVLAEGPLKWAKFTHEEGYPSKNSTYELIATYRLEWPETPEKLDRKKCFYWHSGSQFLKHVAKNPSIAGEFHGCGPGNTYQVIRDYLTTHHLHHDQLRIFLNEEDWRQQCTK